MTYIVIVIGKQTKISLKIIHAILITWIIKTELKFEWNIYLQYFDLFLYDAESSTYLSCIPFYTPNKRISQLKSLFGFGVWRKMSTCVYCS